MTTDTGRTCPAEPSDRVLLAVTWLLDEADRSPAPFVRLVDDAAARWTTAPGGEDHDRLREALLALGGSTPCPPGR